MILPKHRQKIYLSDVQEDPYMSDAMMISSVDYEQINNTLKEMCLDRLKQDFKDIPDMADEIRTGMSTVILLLDEITLWSILIVERDIGDYQSVIGATNFLKGNYLLEEKY